MCNDIVKLINIYDNYLIERYGELKDIVGLNWLKNEKMEK